MCVCAEWIKIVQLVCFTICIVTIVITVGWIWTEDIRSS